MASEDGHELTRYGPYSGEWHGRCSCEAWQAKTPRREDVDTLFAIHIERIEATSGA